jgi:hypothetical protein
MSEQTLNVLKTIGIPSLIKGNPLLDATPERLLTASLNKISLLYMETLAKFGKIDNENAELNRLRTRHKKMLELAVFLGNLFNDHDISYSIMKTLRPFAYAGADVDVLLGNTEDFSRAVKKLQEHNFTFLSQDLFSATMVRKDFEVNVDLQLGITVSNLPYINKRLLLQNVKEIKINGNTVKTLDAHADVNVIACHALYKENMYTLADFYSTALFITRENSKTLCKLAEQTKSTAAVSAMLTWTQRIADAAFGINLPGIDDALRCLGLHTIAGILNGNELRFPLRFSRSLVFLSLINKIYRDDYTRSSLIQALCSNLSRRQLGALMRHFSRESY